MTDADEALVSELRSVGIDGSARLDDWRETIGLLAAIDEVGRSGANVIVKVDGGRAGADLYTVVLSGGRLGEDFFRKDGSDLRSLLSEGLSFFVSHART